MDCSSLEFFHLTNIRHFNNQLELPGFFFSLVIFVTRDLLGFLLTAHLCVVVGDLCINMKYDFQNRLVEYIIYSTTKRFQVELITLTIQLYYCCRLEKLSVDDLMFIRSRVSIYYLGRSEANGMAENRGNRVVVHKQPMSVWSTERV